MARDPYAKIGVDRAGDQLGQLADDVAATGQPVLLTKRGALTGAMLAPIELLRAVPPAYLDQAIRQAGEAAVDNYLAEFDPEDVAAAAAWAEGLTADPPHVRRSA